MNWEENRETSRRLAREVGDAPALSLGEVRALPAGSEVWCPWEEGMWSEEYPMHGHGSLFRKEDSDDWVNLWYDGWMSFGDADVESFQARMVKRGES